MKNLNALLKSENGETIIFSFSAIALSSLICFAAYFLGNSNLAIFSIFTPSLVALIMTAASRGRKGVYDLFVRQTFKKFEAKWLLLSLLGIPVLAGLSVLTALNWDVTGFDLRSTRLMPQVLVILLISVGEEYGWRGFLLPRLLKKFSLFKSSVVLGLIWGFWHFPAYLIGTGVPEQMSFLVFLLWVVLGTLFISWIYFKTGSVLTSIFAHMAANAAFNYLPLLPEATGSMKTFWIFLIYLTLFLTVVFFKGRNLFFTTKE